MSAPAAGKRWHESFSPTWFLSRRPYLIFMLRELSAVSNAAFFLFWVYGLRRLLQGPEAWNAFLEYARSPLLVTFHLVAFALACVHTVTWFELMPLIGDDANKRLLGIHVPKPVMALGIWLGLAAVSLAVLLVLFYA